MKSIRTFFKKEIFAEVFVPAKQFTKVLIMCDGAPSVPSKKTLAEFFVKKGYVVIHIRYRGTWESRGVFLEKSLDQDILDVIDELAPRRSFAGLPKGFVDLWTKEKYKIDAKKIVLLGSSFGGPAVILASRDPRVDKVIAVSPVIDWARDGKAERMKDFIPYMLDVFGMVYRTNRQGWDKLMSGTFYSPHAERKTVDGSKIFILAAKDDDVVPFQTTAQFAKFTRATLIAKKTGGHIRSTLIIQPALWKKISKFL